MLEQTCKMILAKTDQFTSSLKVIFTIESNLNLAIFAILRKNDPDEIDVKKEFDSFVREKENENTILKSMTFCSGRKNFNM